MSEGLSLTQEIESPDPLVDVVCVHGLTGDPKETWKEASGDEFWPFWLGEDFQCINLYTLGYPASLFEKFAKKEMDIFERANNVLEQLAGLGLGRRPLVFITHSLGGILTKVILRNSDSSDDEDWKQISKAVMLVVFLATPHTGASLAAVLNLAPRSSKHVKLLANEFGFLEDLNQHYRSFVYERGDLSTVVYYEMHKTKGALVVDRKSADPGVMRTTPVALDKNHSNICKAVGRNDIMYLGIKRHILRVVQTAQIKVTQTNTTSMDQYEEKSPYDRRDLLDKLIDAGREAEYNYANNAQNEFARRYIKTGLLSVAKDNHDALLADIETRFVTHIYHPLICADATHDEIRDALQSKVIDPLSSKQFGEVRCTSKLILSGLYYLTEQCHIRWDKES